jgi:hypothetical protein
VSNKYSHFSKVKETRTALFKFKSCHVKVSYNSAEAAAQNGSDVYLCKLCDKYHRSTVLKKGIRRLTK